MRTVGKWALVVGLVGISAQAWGQGAKYVVTNDTGTVGGSTFPVTTLVSFQSLDLIETFADATTLDIPLFVGSTQTTTLTALQVTAATKATDLAAHGGVTSAVLTGTFSRTSWQVASTANGPKTAVTVLPNFSASILNPTTNKLVPIYGVDSTSGEMYEAGQFNTTPAALPITPEPGTIALVAAGGLVGAGLRLRRRR